MAELGFKELVPEENAGHIITCFYYPRDPNFSFEKFYRKLSDIGVNMFVLLFIINLFGFQVRSSILVK